MGEIDFCSNVLLSDLSFVFLSFFISMLDIDQHEPSLNDATPSDMDAATSVLYEDR